MVHAMAPFRLSGGALSGAGVEAAIDAGGDIECIPALASVIRDVTGTEGFDGVAVSGIVGSALRDEESLDLWSQVETLADLTGLRLVMGSEAWQRSDLAVHKPSGPGESGRPSGF